MPRLITVAYVLSVLTLASAQDSISPETVTAVKKATVFIRVESGVQPGTGSGFVVSTDGDKAFVLTTHHVVNLAVRSRATVSVVFDSGTKTERLTTAEIITSDGKADLAVLCVTGVKDPPPPIDYSGKLKLVETTPVYTFGFPLADVLTTKSDGFPAITISKASISRLVIGRYGELIRVQIDGNVNTCDSGAPIVDVKGRLVGVGTATIRKSNGIGTAIPHIEVDRLLEGRPSPIRRHTVTKLANGKFRVRCEADVVDPLNKLRGGTMYYRFVPGTEAGSEKGNLEKEPNAVKASLKIEKNIVVGEFEVDKNDGGFRVQLVPEYSDSRVVTPSSIQWLSLDPAPTKS